MIAYPPSNRFRIIAILEPYLEAEQVLRAAKRRAELEKMAWEAVVIDTPRRTEAENEVLEDLLMMAGHMGGIVTRHRASHFIDGVTAIYRNRQAQNITIFSIEICEIPPQYSRLWQRLGFVPSHLQEVKKKLGDKCDIVPIPLFKGEERRSMRNIPLFHFSLRHIAYGLLTVGLGVLLIEGLKYGVPEAFDESNRNKSLIFIVACGVVAANFGLISGILACLACFLILNIFYITPLYEIKVSTLPDMVNLALFLMAGLILSIFGDKNLATNRINQRRANRLYNLLRIHRSTQYKQTKEEVLIELDKEVQRVFEADVIFYLPNIMHHRQLDAQLDRQPVFTHDEREALKACWEEDKTTGRGIHYYGTCNWRFEPLSTARQILGVLAVHATEEQASDRSYANLISGVADQIAIILERIDLEYLAEESRLHAAREKLRSALLSSVSHDLKTPLASVIGSLSVYRSMESSLDATQRKTLIATALSEAQRLDGFITNILDMSKIESGQIRFKKEWFTPEMLTQAIEKRMHDKLSSHPIQVRYPTDAADISADMDMTLQACINVIDNAIKYAPNGKEIDLHWYNDGAQLALAVRDYGRGVPEGQYEAIFDKYSRLSRQDTQVAGTGLGLPIARAIMQGQGGSLVAANHPRGGAIFTFYFPEWRLRTNQEIKVA
jgi:two-component system sensor histidine kinase KdpD